jgi:hypothetical protein
VQDWSTFTDPDGNDLHTAAIIYHDVPYWLLKDKNDTLLVYDRGEWETFLRSAREGDFDHNKTDM